ncbi:NAD/NADP octopine/nopaline dehydrogenase family protein [Phaeovulum sp. W22_SRMD_FR3]|uniref:NAD/NADP octopine/nopaline dehydrogenase family protein n=1 Tax=Phaeovulum sp. W22_SRMD_FR3 TaxID=3240274 RepID=UPI003F9D7853
MTTIAVLGAGSIGLGMAAFFASQGHSVRLHGRSIAADQPALQIDAQGALDWRGPVAAHSALGAAVAGAEVILLCVPGDAQKTLIDALVPVLKDGQTVLISAQYSLSALYLSQQLHVQGLSDVPVVALATTMLTGRRTSAQSVRVLSIRNDYGFALYAGARAAQTAALVRALSGKDLRQIAMTEVVFGNANPIAHVPNALCNLTRIELGEEWSNYGKMTASVCALIEKLDAERCRIAALFGAAPVTFAEHLHRSFGAAKGSVQEMVQAIGATRSGLNGPATLSSRYLTEDVPYGLVLLAHLAAVAGAEAPAHAAFITLLSVACGRDFGAENDLLAPLALRGMPLAEVRRVLDMGWGA